MVSSQTTFDTNQSIDFFNVSKYSHNSGSCLRAQSRVLSNIIWEITKCGVFQNQAHMYHDWP